MKEEVSELWELIVAYIKQETVVPLKSILRFLVYGLVGSIVMIFGFGFMVLGVLRLVQNETGSSFRGHLSWIPYIVALFFALMLGGLSFLGISRHSKSKERSD